MNRFRHLGTILLFVLVAACGGDGGPTPTLVGDELTIARRYPTADTPFWSPSEVQVQVAVGTSDAVRWIAAPTSFTGVIVDAEANVIELTLLNDSTYVGSSGFDGFVISGFSHRIKSLTATNETDIDVTVTHTGTEIFINLSGDYVHRSRLAIAVELE